MSTAPIHGLGHREVCFDTETTGLDPNRDRVIEIACVEIIDLLPTGREFHVYIDPERDVPAESVKIHGLTREFLRGKPKFRDVVDEFLAFIGDSPLVAHNAGFDIRFINAEFKRLRRPELTNRYTDTVSLAKRRFPGGKITLDDLCRKFGIDLSARVKHGALIDTQLLAKVYLELHGGREQSLALDAVSAAASLPAPVAPQRPPRPVRMLGLPTADELAAHDGFLGGLKNALWKILAAQNEVSEVQAPAP